MVRLSRLALLLAVASCGGNVVLDSSTTPSTSTCADVCATITTACPTNPPNCTTLCGGIDKLEAAGACPTEISAYLSCLQENPTFTCMTQSTVCLSVENAFLNCLMPFCQQNPATCT